MNRKKNIDILKLIGLLCIVLAHVSPPGIIFQLRNFDVVLMIIVSIYLGLSSNKKEEYIQYVKRRFYRLVLPSWIFLSIFFLISMMLPLCDIDIKTIVYSYALIDGIGYVWIIRIYLIIAMILPLYKYISNKLNKKIHTIIVIIAYIVYEILCHYNITNSNISNYIFAYVIPCYALIGVSKTIFNNNKKNSISVGIISLAICIGIGFILYKQTGTIQSTQIMKYPFRLYYLSYGVFVSTLLILITNSRKICELFSNKVVQFISSHSLWIYLWHILFIYILKDYSNWIIKYIVVMIASISITFIQSTIVNKMETKNSKKYLAIFKG